MSIQKSYTLLSSTVKTALDQIHENFIEVPIYKATNNVALICKCFYASVITKELGLGNNGKTNTYKDINDLSYNHIGNKNISDLSFKYVIANVSIKIVGYLTCIGCLKCIKPPLTPDLL